MGPAVAKSGAADDLPLDEAGQGLTEHGLRAERVSEVERRDPVAHRIRVAVQAERDDEIGVERVCYLGTLGIGRDHRLGPGEEDLHAGLVHPLGEPPGDVPEQFRVGDGPVGGVDPDWILGPTGAGIEADPFTGEHGTGGAGPLLLDERGDVPALEQGREPAQGVQGLGTDHTVRGERAVALEVGDGRVREGAEGPVHQAGVEPELAESSLQLGDIVPRHRPGDDIAQVPGPQHVAGVVERGLGGRTHDSVGDQRTRLLEGQNGLLQVGVEDGVGTREH